MPNHHLKNMDLSLDAKGLLSVVLNFTSLWEYPINYFNVPDLYEGEGNLDPIIKELEEQGYLISFDVLDEEGRLQQNQYVVIEFPQKRIITKS